MEEVAIIRPGPWVSGYPLQPQSKGWASQAFLLGKGKVRPWAAESEDVAQGL